MPFNTVQTRAPKQFGDFGEGLVTYTLIRKGFEVAKVDHVGADLIAEHKGRRYAISVKSRMYRSGSVETKGVLLKQDDIDKLEFFSAQFGMAPLFAHVCSIADDKVIHLVMFPVSIVSLVMSETKEGYRRDIRHLIINDMVDYSCWRDEKIGHLSFENAYLAGSN